MGVYVLAKEIILRLALDSFLLDWDSKHCVWLLKRMGEKKRKQNIVFVFLEVEFTVFFFSPSFSQLPNST